MEKKRITYLFGSGAVIDWKAPSTPYLTKLICNSGFKCKDKGKYVTQKLKEILSDYLPFDEINFETILNAIEELMVYYSSKEYDKPNSILFPFLTERENLDLIFNYKVIGGIWGHGKNLSIPGHDDARNKLGALQGQSEKQFYLELLYKKLLTNINARISKYAYHTASHTVINTKNNKQINTHFVNWVKSHNNSIHRIYTLNYDRLFSVLLKNEYIDTFEGASFNSGLRPQKEYDFDLKKISSDFETHCHYNIHGSVFWKVYNRNMLGLDSVSLRINGAPNFTSNEWEVPIIEMEKGKKIIVSNIISGYQKTQKLSVSPFRQMQSAFDRDCLFSDKIYIVGYSFGDKHINEILRVAIKENPNVEIEIIDPGYKNGLELKAKLEIWSDTGFNPIISNDKFSEYLIKENS
jgi:hypothetical protein